MRISVGDLRQLIREAAEGKRWYHGTRQPKGGTPQLRDWSPFFMTSDPRSAVWYAMESEEHHSLGGLPSAVECKVTYSNPASRRDLERIVQAVGASVDDIKAMGRWAGDENENDMLYLRKVLEGLETEGFDSFLGEDQLEQDWIPLLVTWHPHQVRFVKSWNVDDYEASLDDDSAEVHQGDRTLERTRLINDRTKREWWIERRNTTLVIGSGKVGGQPRETVKLYPSLEKARQQYFYLATVQRRKGYREAT